MTKIGFRDHDGGLSACCVADRWRLVVAVERVERYRQTGSTRRPLGSLADRTVGDVTQRAVSPPEPRPDPVRQFTAKRGVGVVNANETHDPLRR